MPKRTIHSLTQQFRAANITLERVADELEYDRGTIRERMKKPGKFTISEIHVLAGLLKKTPSAVFKLISRYMEDIASNPDPTEATGNDRPIESA